MTIQPPCKDCEKRHVGCHNDDCAEWVAFQKQNQERLKKLIQTNEDESNRRYMKYLRTKRYAAFLGKK